MRLTLPDWLRTPGPLALLLIGLVRVYQYTVRPLIGANCRFEPHCSAYAVTYLRTHGALRGSLASAWRILRCNPWSAGGYDPVPPAKTSMPHLHMHGPDCAAHSPHAASPKAS